MLSDILHHIFFQFQFFFIFFAKYNPIKTAARVSGRFESFKNSKLTNQTWLFIIECPVRDHILHGFSIIASA